MGGRGRLPARGRIEVDKVSNTIHLMAIPVRPGTTDDGIQAYYAHGHSEPPPFFAPGPVAGAGVQSPGRHLALSYDLPAGKYVLRCFVADDEVVTLH